MSIKLWKEDDRPREKFYLKGKSSVSDSELLAILIGMGSREKSALDLAKDILSDNDNSLEKLSRLTIKELMEYKGIGEAKAKQIALELPWKLVAAGAKPTKKNWIKSIRVGRCLKL